MDSSLDLVTVHVSTTVLLTDFTIHIYNKVIFYHCQKVVSMFFAHILDTKFIHA